MSEPTLRVIARIQSDFPSKFGIPRQSGLVPSLQSTLVFEPDYRNEAACRGLEDFSHIWLIWGFSEARRAEWSPTVRPPRLGGNRRVGVFATRSPFRPNAIGLSVVRLDCIEQHPELGPVLHILGADLMDGSPIYDIKPYLPYADWQPDATGGFTQAHARQLLRVVLPPPWDSIIPAEKRGALLGVLENDPRPSYQDDPGRRYGMEFAGMEIKFTVEGDVLTVQKVERLP